MGATARPLFEPPERDEFILPRLRWLVRLRWLAVAGITVAVGLTLAGYFPGTSWEVMAGTAGALALYNVLLWRGHRRHARGVGWRGPLAQALFDILALTTVLWAAGGIDSPFVGYYVFHVALAGILAGPRPTWAAAAATVLGAALLASTRAYPSLALGRWAPVPPWDLLTELAAFATTAGGVAYLVIYAMAELRGREAALSEAREHLALEYELLRTTLQELEAGLEVVDNEGNIVWRNKRAEELAPQADAGRRWDCPGKVGACEEDVAGECPVHIAHRRGSVGCCRFAAQIDGAERVYERMAFPLEYARRGAQPTPRLMNLYIDRTEATLDEQRLVTTERLVSLGRVAQGVAHELNTPLATIRTLSTDMRAAIVAAAEPPGLAGGALLPDLAESAQLIQDETRRLGRITQALLAGGDLVRTQIDGDVPIAAAVERARALVFAGSRGGPGVEVGEGIDRLEVSADRDRLVQVLVNLLQNARDAVSEDPEAAVAVRAEAVDGHVEITIDDGGPGLAPEVQGRLFEPFTTTKPPGKGTGLGLYTSYMLVRAMGGTLTLANREDGGVRAVVRLPHAGGPTGLAPASSLTQRAS